jgi:hypothetical protein
MTAPTTPASIDAELDEIRAIAGIMLALAESNIGDGRLVGGTIVRWLGEKLTVAIDQITQAVQGL